MTAELMIIAGLMLMVSGSCFLIINGKKEKKKNSNPSLTQVYQLQQKHYQRERVYKILGVILEIIAILATFYWWWMGKYFENVVLFGLTVITTLWFLQMRRNLLAATLMALVTGTLVFFSIYAAAFWLLTVIGCGFWFSNEKYRKIPVLQFTVLLNAIGALDFLFQTFSYEDKTDLSQLKTGKPEKINGEGLIVCPVCQKTMEFCKIQDGEEKILFDKCPECGSIWFDDRDWLWAIFNSFVHGLTTNKKSFTCPRCNLKLKVSKQAIDPTRAKVYHCHSCEGNLLI